MRFMWVTSNLYPVFWKIWNSGLSKFNTKLPLWLQHIQPKFKFCDAFLHSISYICYCINEKAWNKKTNKNLGFPECNILSLFFCQQIVTGNNTRQCHKVAVWCMINDQTVTSVKLKTRLHTNGPCPGHFDLAHVH
jgi:hypothetical protein